MPYTPINRGTAAGDGTGEVTFTAWGKANAMFEELFNQIALIDAYPFVKVGDSFIKKDAANTDRTILQTNDIVLWKRITNGGDPLVLTGAHVYLGGDEQLEVSYEIQDTVVS